MKLGETKRRNKKEKLCSDDGILPGIQHDRTVPEGEDRGNGKKRLKRITDFEIPYLTRRTHASAQLGKARAKPEADPRDTGRK